MSDKSSRLLSPSPIGGTIRAIASKSHAHRLLIAAAMADKDCTIYCPERSKDIDATVQCLEGFGARIAYSDSSFHVTPIREVPTCATIDCGESGSTLRFLIPVSAALGIDTTFIMHGRLPERPLSPLWEELERHGISLSRPTETTLRVCGKLSAGTYEMAGDISSQFFTGLLLSLPYVDGQSDLLLTSHLESADYVALTLASMAQFGVEVEVLEKGWRIQGNTTFKAPETISVEGDRSNSAFWLCAGAISQAVTVTGLVLDSYQGDHRILDVLKSFGANVVGTSVSPAPLHGIDLDASTIPDLVPPIALVACCAEGTTRIYGAARLRIKESDRLESVANLINSLGGNAVTTADGMIIQGCKLHGGQVDSCNDHRIAMMAAIASSVCDNSILLVDDMAVEKSYPLFWQHWSYLRGETK